MPRHARRQIAWQDDFDRHAMACWSAIPLNDEYFSFTALQLRPAIGIAGWVGFIAGLGAHLV